MSYHDQTIQSQLILGSHISETFALIMEEQKYSFNKDDSIFFQIEDDYLLALPVPHQERHNTKENVLFEFDSNFYTSIKKDYVETLAEFTKEIKKLFHHKKINEEDYDLIISELNILKLEQPSLYLFATHNQLQYS